MTNDLGLEEDTKVYKIVLSFISYIRGKKELVGNDISLLLRTFADPLLQDSRKDCTEKAHQILFLSFSLFHLFINSNAMLYTMNLPSFLKLIWLSFSQTIPAHVLDG